MYLESYGGLSRKAHEWGGFDAVLIEHWIEEMASCAVHGMIAVPYDVLGREFPLANVDDAVSKINSNSNAMSVRCCDDFGCLIVTLK